MDNEFDFKISDDSILWFRNRMWVPNDSKLKQDILKEVYFFKLSIHPSSTKMYHNLKSQFLWLGMKRDILNFISKCLTCQHIKIEHQWPSGLL